MRKIPTLFVRNLEHLRYVTREVHPDCQWVLDGEGYPTRKYDGTCTLFAGAQWWARREVKPGRPAPAEFVPVETDPTTGKTVGWEPIAQSAFAKFHTEALEGNILDVVDNRPGPVAHATYELLGPKVNGNPEGIGYHLLVRHGYIAAVDYQAMQSMVRTFDDLRAWLLAHKEWEGVVWHHPDGRMAKLKRRDFNEGGEADLTTAQP